MILTTKYAVSFQNFGRKTNFLGFSRPFLDFNLHDNEPFRFVFCGVCVFSSYSYSYPPIYSSAAFSDSYFQMLIEILHDILTFVHVTL